ncbi:MAG: 2TM domain-containing protein [Nitrososphaerota archaeon]
MNASEEALEDFKKAWIEFELEEANRGFSSHLASYIIVNVFLVFINLYTSPATIWFVWPLFGWGIGLAFHFVFSRKRFVVAECEKKIANIEMKMKAKKATEKR